MSAPRILWADDEIDLLRPHVIFLEAKGYTVDTVSNGADAVARAEQERYDVVFLDEQMPGLDGLGALAEIKSTNPDLPVIMITKSEEEHLMEDALGQQIADYLIKPVNPKQILLACKRILEGDRLRGEKKQQAYLQRFGPLAARLGGGLSWTEWIEVYQELIRHDAELADADESVRQILADQYREANQHFGRFIQDEYEGWIKRFNDAPDDDGRPPMSPDVVTRWVLPHLRNGKKVVFLLIDCMRYDQWLTFERVLRQQYDTTTDWHLSILPTATPFSRNAIFSGLLPKEIAKRFPQLWRGAERDEHSKNQNEEDFLNDLLRRRRVDARLRYEKIIKTADGQQFADRAQDYAQHDLSAIVVNFVDILAHSRSDSDVLKEIAPDEAAYRALTATWFEHSWLRRALDELAKKDVTVVITTDHGAVRSLRPAKVIGDRETSTSLRYKHGRNLKADEREAIFVKNPETFGLPRQSGTENYIFAKEDYYFVYPTNYNKYVGHYNDTFQHGGCALEEMLLPVITMTPRAA